MVDDRDGLGVTGKHLIDSFLGQPNRHLRYQSEKIPLTPDYWSKYTNYFKTNMSLAEPKFGRGKKIKVWANGEAHCYEFNINPKDFRSWTSILLHITNAIRPIFGAVRRLVALSTLTIVDNFEALDSTERYIALGATCRFKSAAGGYRTSSEKELYKREKVSKRFYAGETNTKFLPFLKETEKKKLTIIYMTVNGRSYQTPQKVVLNSNDMKNWGLIFKYLTKVMDMPDGIAYICTIFGDVLQETIQFQHGYLYVAVPFKEPFKPMDYMSLFEDHNSKYRSSYTLTIRPALSTPEKLYSAIRKIKKRMRNEECNGCSKIPTRPSTPLQNKRSSLNAEATQPPLIRQVTSMIQKELPARCDSELTEQVVFQQILQARCDSQPSSKVTGVFQEVAHPIEACDYQLPRSSTSKQTSFAALAAYSKRNVNALSSTPSDSDPPTYTVLKIPSGEAISNSRIVSGCNLMSVVDREFIIEDNIITVGSGEFYHRNPKDNFCITTGDRSKFVDVDGDDRTDQIEIPGVKHSTVVIRDLRDQTKVCVLTVKSTVSSNFLNNSPGFYWGVYFGESKPRNGIIVSPEHSPAIRIRNRTDIIIYNLNSANTNKDRNKTRESECDFEVGFENGSRKNNSSEHRSTNTPQSELDESDKESSGKTAVVLGNSSNVITENLRYSDLETGFTPPYESRPTIKRNTFTLNSLPDNRLQSVFKTNETVCIDNSDDVSDTEGYQTFSEEETSQSSSDTKPFICEKGDNSVRIFPNRNTWSLHIANYDNNRESDQCGVDYKIKENILEIKDVRKSLQKRIGIGSFRVSTPDVENCLRYSLDDDVYVQEDVSYCSISADSIESK